MRPSQVITLQIWNGTVWENYTDGLINVKIVRGVEDYTGPLSQPDVGQMTLTSRNDLLDPYNNNIVKYNAPIRLNAAGVRIFTGRIEGINVDYKPAGDPPIVTINAIDMIGTMHKHILSDDFLATYETTQQYLSHLNEEIEDFVVTTNNYDNIAYSEGHSESGTTALNAMLIRTKTDLGFIFANARNEIEYFRRDKNSNLHPYNAKAPDITFDYFGNAESYKTISLSDGFEKIVNNIDITGTQNTSISSSADDSIALWGKSSATVNLQTHVTANLQYIANAVLQEMAEPIREIYKISWDATLDYDTAHGIDISDNIQINHKVSDTFTINRKYSVIGIQHEINADEWLVTYSLRNFDYQSTSIPNPVIVVTPNSGDTNTTFTVTWTHPNPQLFASTYWDLDETFTSTNRTTTVNYDIVGTKQIKLEVTTIYGYTKTVTIPLQVAIAPPIAAFTYTLDSNNVYNFTFTGDSATSYEWTFGDGETSTEKNPKHYYFTGGSRTITVKATNSLGFTTASQTINTVALTKIPVRYVRVRWTNFTNNSTTYYNSYGSIPTYAWFKDFKILNISNSEITNWSIINHEEYYGYFSDFYSLDDYGRITSIPHDNLDYTLTGLGGVIPVKFSDYTPSGTDVAYASTIIDLGQEYFNVSKIQITRDSNSTNFGTVMIMDVSRDMGVWYEHGRTYTFNNELNTRFDYKDPINDPLSPATVPMYTLNAAPTQPDYYPVRYVRMVSNTPASIANKRFQFNEIIACAGSSNILNNGTFTKTVNTQSGTYTFTASYPISNAIGLGAINYQAATGTAISYPTSYNTGTITYVGPLSSYAQNINPGTVIPSANYKNTKDYIYWEETAGAKTILLDFGRPLKKITGFYIDVRDRLATTTNAPDTNFAITIYVSSDGTNWVNLGQYALQQSVTQYGAIGLNSAEPIKSNTVFVGSGITSGGQVPTTP
jgi:hypothetical protein